MVIVPVADESLAHATPTIAMKVGTLGGPAGEETA